MRRRAPRILVVTALGAALSGCVAAAIPIVAAGGLVKSRTDGPDRTASAAQTRIAVPPAPQAPPAAAPVPTDETVLDDGTTVRVLPTNVLPPPGPADRLGTDESKRVLDAFYGRASAQARLDPVETPRNSALLAAPGTLAPETRDCSILPPAVLVDLDPGKAAYDPGAALPFDRRLSNTLAALRAQDVTVFWLSGASAAQAGAIRRNLRTQGLDSFGRDELLVMRYPDDTKQLRRREIGETHCLVAILGDERSDFDELYAYLRDPAAATALDPLLGSRWFLLPQS